MLRWRNFSKFGGGAKEVLALLALGSGSCLEEVSGEDSSVCKVFF